MSEIILTSNSAGAEESSKALSGVNVQTAKVHVGAAEHEEFEQTEAKNVEVGVFMDGTWNNRNNTNARKEYEKKQNGEYYKSDIADNYIDEDVKSFESDYSNIARMKPFYKDKNKENLVRFSIYIEGIGTKNNEKDSGLGGGFGIGGTGLYAKVKKACERIADVTIKNGGEDINDLSIDIFGFSRGAAAARNLVYEITKSFRPALKNLKGETVRKMQYRHGQLGKKLEEEGISLRMLTVRFVGLYDTVSSYGFDLMFDDDDDTDTLQLDAIRKAIFTLQLTASDEHRDYFALTNIKSALDVGRGAEYALPGVHADIGGSYVDGQKERKMFRYSEREYLLKQGWYIPDQLTEKKVPTTPYRREFDIDYERFVEGIRTLPNTYSFIPLTIMAEMMIEKEIPIYSSDLKNDYKISNELNGLKNRIFDHVFGNGPSLEFTAIDELNQKLAHGEISSEAHRQKLKDSIMLMKLRNGYLHFSAGSGIVNKPNRDPVGLRKREIIDG